MEYCPGWCSLNSDEVQPTPSGRTPLYVSARPLDPVHAHLSFTPRPCLRCEEATITRAIERLMAVVPLELYLAVSLFNASAKSIFKLYLAWGDVR